MGVHFEFGITHDFSSDHRKNRSCDME